MNRFDGKSMIPEDWSVPDTIFSTNSSLKMCGEWCEPEFFKAHFPAWITENQKVSINELELLAFTVAMHKWAGNMKNKNILAYCDNQLAVEVINSGKARNRFTQACLRDIAFNLAVVNGALKVIYIASKCN